MLTIGEYYRLKSTPNYSWVKVLRILKPNTPQNKNRFIVVECEHTVGKNDLFGFVRLFRLHEIDAKQKANKLPFTDQTPVTPAEEADRREAGGL